MGGSGACTPLPGKKMLRISLHHCLFVETELEGSSLYLCVPDSTNCLLSWLEKTVHKYLLTESMSLLSQPFKGA